MTGFYTTTSPCHAFPALHSLYRNHWLRRPRCDAGFVQQGNTVIEANKHCRRIMSKATAHFADHPTAERAARTGMVLAIEMVQKQSQTARLPLRNAVQFASTNMR